MEGQGEPPLLELRGFGGVSSQSTLESMLVDFKSEGKRHPSASSEVKLREDKVRTQKGN